jgi:hypothetical protein
MPVKGRHRLRQSRIVVGEPGAIDRGVDGREARSPRLPLETLGPDPRRAQHPRLRLPHGARDRRIERPGCRDRLQRRLVGGEHVEAAHNHFEQRIARRLRAGAMRRSGQHGVIDHAHERRERVGLAVELAPHVDEAHAGRLGDIRQRNLPPGALGGELQRSGDQPPANCELVQHGLLPCCPA